MFRRKYDCGGCWMSLWRKDDGGIIAGLLVLVLAVGIAYGGYVGYHYWDDNKDTTPPPATVSNGGEELSSNGVTLVIPRGWNKAPLNENQVQRWYDVVAAAKPKAASRSGLDQTTVDPDSLAFAAEQGNGGKNDEGLVVVTIANSQTNLDSVQTAYTVLLKRLGASKIKWEKTTLGDVDAIQVDYRQDFGSITVYQREYFLIGDTETAQLTFNALQPIGNKDADGIAETMRVD